MRTNESRPDSRINKILACLAGSIAATLVISSCSEQDESAPLDNRAPVEVPFNGECSVNFADNVVRSALNHRGFKEGIDYQIVPESHSVDMVGDPGINSFTNDPVNSEAEFSRQISSNIPAAQLLREELFERNGVSLDELNNSGNIVFVTFNNGVEYPKNTQYENGQIVEVGQTVFEGTDAAIFYVSKEACDIFVRDAQEKNINGKSTLIEAQEYVYVFRSGCLNPQRVLPLPKTQQPEKERPIQPTPYSYIVPEPYEHPQPTPEPTYYPPKPPQPLPKEPSRDVLVNPYDPPAVQGPGSPNNQPAQTPVDSGNGGIPATIPQPNYNSPQSTHSHPPSGHGSGDVLPAPTEPPIPANNAPSANNPAEGNGGGF